MECRTLPIDRNIDSEFRIERPSECITFYGEGGQILKTAVEGWHPTKSESKNGWEAKFRVIIEVETLKKLKYDTNQFTLQAGARLTQLTYTESNMLEFTFSKLNWDTEKSRR